VAAGYLFLTATLAAIGAWLNAFAAFVLLPVVLGAATGHFFRRRARSRAAIRWPGLLAGNALLLLLLLSLAFLGLETYYRFIFDQTDGLADTLVSQKWSQRYIHKNNLGQRDNIDYACALTPGKRRITFVGDSFAVGLGVKDVEARFANRIRRLHPDWEVHVVAQPGLETSNEVEAVHNLVVSNRYQLDLVVLVYNMNDIGEVMPNWIAEYKRLLPDRFRNSWLCRHSYFVNLYYQRWQFQHSHYFQHYFDEVQAAYSGPIFDRHRIALTAMCNMTVIRGGRLLVVTFPFMHAPLQFEAAHDRMARFWREKEVPHLDLLSVYSNLAPARITVNPHDAHPNEFANVLAAEAIDTFLKNQIGKNPKNE